MNDNFSDEKARNRNVKKTQATLKTRSVFRGFESLKKWGNMQFRGKRTKRHVNIYDFTLMY